jgi:hypothetical protein
MRRNPGRRVWGRECMEISENVPMGDGRAFHWVEWGGYYGAVWQSNMAEGKWEACLFGGDMVGGYFWTKELAATYLVNCYREV